MTAFDSIRLVTPRLVLRQHVPGDAAALFAMHSDPQVMRYWSTPPWTSPETAVEALERHRRKVAAGEYVQLAISLAGDDSLLGTCTLFSFYAQCRRAELGYALARPAWGKGYMHEALTALLDFGFGELGLHRVEADADPRNTHSTRSLERLGFTREGLLRERWIVGDEVSDTAFYGLLAREWRARRSAEGTARP